MKLTNSDTHSCMHSLASLDTCHNKLTVHTLPRLGKQKITYMYLSGFWDGVPHYSGHIVDGEKAILFAVDGWGCLLLGSRWFVYWVLKPQGLWVGRDSTSRHYTQLCGTYRGHLCVYTYTEMGGGGVVYPPSEKTAGVCVCSTEPRGVLTVCKLDRTSVMSGAAPVRSLPPPPPSRPTSCMAVAARRAAAAAVPWSFITALRATSSFL